jgi:hypothetical protein
LPWRLVFEIESSVVGIGREAHITQLQCALVRTIGKQTVSRGVHTTKGYILFQVLNLITMQQVRHQEGLAWVLKTPEKGLHIITGKHILLVVGDSDGVNGGKVLRAKAVLHLRNV